MHKERKMTISAAISLGIAIASFIIGIIWKVVDLSMCFGKMAQRMSSNEERDKEERAKNGVKFDAIYNRLAANESISVELEANVKSMSQIIARIENKLDRLIERGGEK